MASNALIEEVIAGNTNPDEAVRFFSLTVDIRDYQVKDDCLILPNDHLERIAGALLPIHRVGFEKIKLKVESIILDRIKGKLGAKVRKSGKRNILLRSPAEDRSSKSARVSENPGVHEAPM